MNFTSLSILMQRSDLEVSRLRSLVDSLLSLGIEADLRADFVLDLLQDCLRFGD